MKDSWTERIHQQMSESSPLLHVESILVRIVLILQKPWICNFFLWEFSWEFVFVYLEGLGWCKCRFLGACETLCDIACKKGHTSTLNCLVVKMCYTNKIALPCLRNTF